MVLQADISHVLEARAEARDCMLAEARTAMMERRALMDRQDEERRPFASLGGGQPSTAS